MKEFINLLERFWILKSEDPEIYYSVKDNYKELSNFAREKLGCRLILKPDFVKLEKIPARAQIWMGLPGFEDKLDYALLCFVLIFLERKSKGERFILSQLTENIIMNANDICKVDWTMFRHRKALVRVMKFASSVGLINTYDGDTALFAENADNDVLYESTGLSRYFARLFIRPVTEGMTIEDIENETDINIDHDKGDYRRHRVYRKLLFSPVVYSDEEADFGYIKNIRGRIREDIEKMTDCRLDIHRTAAMLVLPQSNSFKNVFPSLKAISDIVLQLNYTIRNAIEIPDSERVIMTYPEFYSIVMKLIRGHKSGWSKTYREMTPEEVINEIILYMRGFSMLDYDGDKVTILPLAGKLIGEYPADYNRKTGRSK